MSDPRTPLLPPLPCPECLASGVGGGARIGNRRHDCATCNRWAQNVMRRTRARLKELHADEYERLRLEVERDLYAQIVDDYRAEHPDPVE